MCDVITPILMVAAAAVSGIGQVVSGQQAASAARLKGQMDSQSLQNKASMERRQANWEQVAGQYQARRQQEASERLISKQRVAFAANGVEIDSGSPLDVMVDSQVEADMDRATIEWNAARKGQQLREQATIDVGNAKLATIGAEISADNAITNSYFGAGTTMLNAAGKFGQSSLGKNMFGGM